MKFESFFFLVKLFVKNFINDNKWLNNNKFLFVEMKICINRYGNGEVCSYVKYNKKIVYLKNLLKKL